MPNDLVVLVHGVPLVCLLGMNKDIQCAPSGFVVNAEQFAESQRVEYRGLT